MLAWQTALTHQLEQLFLLRCSLLPDESFAFVLPAEDAAVWTSLLDAFTDAGGTIFSQDDNGNGNDRIASLTHAPCQARFEVRVVGVRTWIEVTMPPCASSVRSSAELELEPETEPGIGTGTGTGTGTGIGIGTCYLGEPPVVCATIRVRGDDDAYEGWWYAENPEIARAASPWYERVTQLVAAVRGRAPGPPRSSAWGGGAAVPDSDSDLTVPDPHPDSDPDTAWHALLTSHHLVSPTKRRTLHHLSTHLALVGFAKVGYPGIMYAQGDREAVGAFVREIKGLQWLALRVRFVEPVPSSDEGSDVGSTGERWVEMTKIGQVLEWMRVRGREALVTDLGIGAPSKEQRR